jgi:hypothetical protein
VCLGNDENPASQSLGRKISPVGQKQSPQEFEVWIAERIFPQVVKRCDNRFV